MKAAVKLFTSVLVMSCMLGCTAIKHTLLEWRLNADWYQLQAPQSLGQPLEQTQFVVMRFGDKSFSSINQIEWTDDKIALASFTHMGGPLFSFQYNEQGIEADISPLLAHYINADMVLRDYQLCFLSASAIRQGLDDTVTLVETSPDTRQFLKDDRLLISIRYEQTEAQPSKVLFENLEQGYSLEIETVTAN